MGVSQLQILKPTDSNGRNTLMSGRAPGNSGKLAAPLTPNVPSSVSSIIGGKSDSPGKDLDGGLNDSNIVSPARDKMPDRVRKPVVRSRDMDAGADLEGDGEALLLAVELNAKA